MSPQQNLRPNRLLTKVAEMVRQHHRLQERDLCPAHQEPIKLFCLEDQSPICVVCREAQEHREHRVWPVEEALREHKDRVKDRRQRIMAEFEKVALFLAEEEQRLLQALKREEEETAVQLRNSKAALDQQLRSLDLLLLQLEDWSLREPLQMLQDMKDTLTRYAVTSSRGGGRSGFRHHTPMGPCVALPFLGERVPGEMGTRGAIPSLAAICLNTSDPDWPHLFACHLFLFGGSAARPDPTLAYPYLPLYESRQRRYLSPLPEGSTTADCGRDPSLAFPCAVGQQSFSGRLCWEVGVNLLGDALWALGMCRDNMSQKDRMPKSPEHGLWVIQLSKGKQLLPWAPTTMPITLTEPPSHVGVFLDFEAGEVSFYSVNDGSHLRTYSQAAFPGPLHPFFCLGTPKSGQMVISTVTMWVKG
ncbi:Tripartite motif-containing protein 17 [Heterocephalus glaber]|uniref:Tripartite motif-containing protein 17 n=1 Tax=Heterocephalus glaber TaxID=10181 RepID=G5C994_HETGA|nr:Tripartite motif-containing protein 17 [Heterocephalus glaber]